ncbi:unnamed protein product [Diplocarpon coronariae]|nr:hypothetical protein JHW43_005656 [Diplocarpon mali]
MPKEAKTGAKAKNTTATVAWATSAHFPLRLLPPLQYRGVCLPPGTEEADFGSPCWTTADEVGIQPRLARPWVPPGYLRASDYILSERRGRAAVRGAADSARESCFAEARRIISVDGAEQAHQE